MSQCLVKKVVISDSGEMSDRCFSGFVCSGHEIACKKWNNIWLILNNDFLVTREAIRLWFSLWLCHTRDNHMRITSLFPKNTLFSLYIYIYILDYTSNFLFMSRACLSPYFNGFCLIPVHLCISRYDLYHQSNISEELLWYCLPSLPESTISKLMWNL